MLFPFIAGLVAFILLVKPLNNRTFKSYINGTGKIQMEQVFYFSADLAVLSAFIYLSILNLILRTFLLIIKLFSDYLLHLYHCSDSFSGCI